MIRDYEAMMRAIRIQVGNDLRGLTLVEDDNSYGYLLKGEKWTEYTLYVSDEGYSVYVAIPDIYKGIDCANEIELAGAQRASIQTCVAKIKADQIAQGNPIYRDAFVAVNSVTDYQHYMNATYGVKP